MAIKFGIFGLENSGKTTLACSIKEALLFNFDRKRITVDIPHANFSKDRDVGAKEVDPRLRDCVFRGVDDLKIFVFSKVKAYETKYEKKPKYLIFDTVTQLFIMIDVYNKLMHGVGGYTRHVANNDVLFQINEMFEGIIQKLGLSIIITGHTQIDEKTGKYFIPSAGAFQKAGSWLSLVNDSIHVERASVVYRKGIEGYAARTTLTDIEQDPIPIQQYDINEHLDKLYAISEKALENSL